MDSKDKADIDAVFGVCVRSSQRPFQEVGDAPGPSASDFRRRRRNIFIASEDGFYVFDGYQSQPLGINRVDEYFTSRLNYPYRHHICCALDPVQRVVMWAYPAEFTDAAVAGQTVDVQNRFVRPGGSSHLFLLTQGYAIFDNPSMPIIGKDGAEPNDTYVQQLDRKSVV